MSLSPSKIKQQFSRLQPNAEWAFKKITRLETNALTHGYHRYPAKFIPQIARKLIEDYTNYGECVCDVFGGCGTTLVEAKLIGRESIGIDVNPVSKLITQTKVNPIRPKILEREISKFLYNLARCKNMRRQKNRHLRISYWFDHRVLATLDTIYAAIKRTKNQKVRKFLFCAFSHNLKNSSRWLMKSIKPTIDKNKNPKDPRISFERHLKGMCKKNRSFYAELLSKNNLNIPARMYKRDSTKTLPIKDNSVDLIVTSPPYVTSYEYADLHQLSLLWLGSDKKNFRNWKKITTEFNNFRKNFVGTSCKLKKKGMLDGRIAEEVIKKLSSVNKTLANNVNNYFIGMKRSFKEIHRILKPKKYVSIIIGNTTLRGIDILNAEVVVEQLQRVGFKKIEFIKREAAVNKAIAPWRDIRTGKFTSRKSRNKKMAYKYEYIIIMQKI